MGEHGRSLVLLPSLPQRRQQKFFHQYIHTAGRTWGGLSFYTEASIDLADDGELVAMMVAAWSQKTQETRKRSPPRALTASGSGNAVIILHQGQRPRSGQSSGADEQLNWSAEKGA